MRMQFVSYLFQNMYLIYCRNIDLKLSAVTLMCELDRLARPLVPPNPAATPLTTSTSSTEHNQVKFSSRYVIFCLRVSASLTLSSPSLSFFKPPLYLCVSSTACIYATELWQIYVPIHVSCLSTSMSLRLSSSKALCLAVSFFSISFDLPVSLRFKKITFSLLYQLGFV